MARYRAFADIDVGIRFPYVQAGTILQDGPGGNIPNNWTPNGAVDPLDQDAVNKIYAAGPQNLSPVLNHWAGINVTAPLTYWIATAIPGLFALTGLGVALAPRPWLDPGPRPLPIANG